MNLFIAGNAGLLAVFVYFFVVFILPNANRPDTAGFVPIFAVFMALFLAIIVAAIWWPGAPRRRWFWLLGSIPALLILLIFSPEIVFDLSHPTLATSFVPT